MKALLSLFMALVVVKAAQIPLLKPSHPFNFKRLEYSDKQTRIANGQQASDGQFPFYAAIDIPPGYFCGGSIISSRWVVTAAHCAVSGDSFNINVGEVAIFWGTTYYSEVKYIHPKYDDLVANDIALLYVSSDIIFTGKYVQPINLPNIGESNLFEDYPVEILGHGKTTEYETGTTPYLMYASVSVMSNSACAQYFGRYIIDSVVCTQGQAMETTCSGDSGGPVVYDNTLVGVISFGYACGNIYPSGHARVTSFRQWISDVSGV
ncbi:chymotrypsin-2-like [Uranotaenia lowii]|uniref:chymotrypsin-2-like n=1 Tax=Uranotaenia lowii TaxID=190385 RepID=UPI0024798667|nr:chymotrypsin-2-like [Uranotaenia lowii]